MRLAVNIDHFATLREARKATEPEPVLVALLAEQAGDEDGDRKSTRLNSSHTR